MNLFVLDSDILSLLQEAHPKVKARAEACQPGDIAISVISVDETLRSWFTMVHRAKKPAQVAKAYDRLARSVSFLSRMHILTFSEKAIAMFEEMRKANRRIDANDLRSAAIAKEHDAIVITRNVSDFRQIAGVKFEDWSQ